LDAETCRGFNEHNKLLTTPLSICWFLSPIHENARYNDQDIPGIITGWLLVLHILKNNDTVFEISTFKTHEKWIQILDKELGRNTCISVGRCICGMKNNVIINYSLNRQCGRFAPSGIECDLVGE
jgi:hypothetical protein